MDAGYWTATPVTSMRVSLITSDHFGSNRLMCSAPAVLSAFVTVSGALLRLSSPLQALWVQL